MIRHLNYIFTVIIILVFISELPAQLITKEEKIRLGIGIAGLSSKQIDQMIDGIEEEVAKLGPEVSVNPFKENITYFFEYSHEMGAGFAYQLNIQYSSNKTRDDNTDIQDQITQGMLFDYNIYELSLDFVYYLPIFMISTSQTSLVFGAGPDLSYVETLSLYYLNQQPAFAQSIRCKRAGGVAGARFLLGWNIPYVESFSMQFRFVYTYRPKIQLPSETEELLIENTNTGRERMDPAYFESFDTYNLSQWCLTFSMAYSF